MKVSTLTTSSSAAVRSVAVSLLDSVRLVLQLMLSVLDRYFSSRSTSIRSRFTLLSNLAASCALVFMISIQGQAQVSINSVCVCSNGNIIVDFNDFPGTCPGGYDIGIQFTADGGGSGIASVGSATTNPVTFTAPFNQDVAATGDIWILSFVEDASCGNPPANVPFVIDDSDPGNLMPVFTSYTQADPLSITNVAGSLDQDVNMDAGLCSGTVPELTSAITTMGGCSITLVQDPADGDSFGAACDDTQVVTITATDACGASETFDVTLTLKDNEDPAFVAPTENIDAGQMVECGDDLDPHSLEATYGEGWPTISDNCLATNIMPADLDAEITAPWDGTAVTLANGFVIAYTDNIISHPGGVCTPAGSERKYRVERTWTITDACGNTISSDPPSGGGGFDFQRINVIDNNVAPTAMVTTDPIALVLDATCVATLTAAEVEDGSTDNCGLYDPLDPSTFDVSTMALIKIEGSPDAYAASIDFSNVNLSSPCPTTITIELQVTDECGNTGTATKDITLTDSTDPTITAPADIDVEGCDTDDIMNGGLTSLAYSETSVTITEAQFTAETGSVSDNCEVNITYVDAMAGTCPTVVTRTFTVTDACGNEATDTQTINIDDTTAPVIDVCPADVTVSVDVNCVPDLTAVAETIDAADITEDCGFTVAFADDDSAVMACTGSANPRGAIVRTFTVTDLCGNTATCSMNITVEDNTAPMITTCPTDATVVGCGASALPATTMDATGFAGVGGVVIDNCTSAADMTYSYADTPMPTAVCPTTVERIWSVTDACGNVNECTQTYTLMPDLEADVSGTLNVCVAGSTILSGNPTGCDMPYTHAWTITNDGGTGATDAANLTDETTVDVTFDATGLTPGTVTVEYTVTDANGCTATDAAEIFIPADCDFEFTIDDPCVCNNDSDVNADNGTFMELVTVTGPSGAALPPGQTWTINSVFGGFSPSPLDEENTPGPQGASLTTGGSGFSYCDVPGGCPVYSSPTGTILIAPQGAYYQVLTHVEFEGYSMSVEGPMAFGTTSNSVLSVKNTCFYPVLQTTSQTAVCVTDGAFTITGTPDASTDPTGEFGFSGDASFVGGNPPYTYATQLGLNDNSDGTATFDPAVAGVGCHTVSYTYKDNPALNTSEPGCYQAIEFEITVFPSDDPSFTLPASACAGDVVALALTNPLETWPTCSTPAVTNDARVRWFGTGVADNVDAMDSTGDGEFTAPAADGTYTICAEVGAGSCTQVFCQDIVVEAAPTAGPATFIGCATAVGTTNLSLATAGGFPPAVIGPVLSNYTGGLVDLSGYLTSGSPNGTWTILDAPDLVGQSAAIFGSNMFYTDPGCYEVRYTNDCGNVDIVIGVGENPTPAFDLPDEVCFDGVNAVQYDILNDLMTSPDYEFLLPLADGRVFTSSDPSVATVDLLTGIVDVVGPGTTTITMSETTAIACGTLLVGSTTSCTEIVQQVLTVIPQPSNLDISADDFVCNSAANQVGLTVTGNNIPTDPNLITWFGGLSGGSMAGAGNVEDNGLTGTFYNMGAAPGIYTVCAQVGEPNCAVTICEDVTVVEQQVVVLSDQNIQCAINPTGLFNLEGMLDAAASSTNAYGGMWTLTSGPASGVISGQTLSYTEPGCYELTYDAPATLAGGTCDAASETAFLYIGEQPQPSFDIQNEVCISAGDPAQTFTPNVSSPTYVATAVGSWMITDNVTGATATIDATTGEVTLTATGGPVSGTYTVSYTETITNAACNGVGPQECDETTDVVVNVQDGTTLDPTFMADNLDPCPTGSSMGATVVNLTPATNGGVFTGVGVIDNGAGTGGTFTAPSCGTFAITYTLTTNAGCTNSYTLSITTDQTAPTVTTSPMDMTVECDGAGNTGALDAWVASFGGAVATDNCQDPTWTSQLVNTISGCGGSSESVYAFTATDGCGNTVTELASFIIEDTTVPAITTTDDLTLDCDDLNGTTDPGALITQWLENNYTASDICGDVTVTYDFTPVALDYCTASTITVTWTATDECGLTSTATSDLIITPDTEVPTISTLADLTLDCDDFGSTSDPSALVTQWLENNYTADDNCELVSVTYDFTPAALDYCTASTTLVTWTATDACGLTNTATSNLIIMPDTEAPTLDQAEPLDDTVQCGSAVPPVPALTFSDNCVAALVVDFSEVTTQSQSTNETTLTRTWVATDDCGQSITVDQVITILDNTVPTVVFCPTDIVVDNDPGVCGAAVSYNLPRFSDNCDPNGTIGTIVTGLNSGSIFPVGETTVTYTFVDGAGNEVATPCTFTVTVTDDEDPTFVNCPDPGFTFNVFTNDCNAAANWSVPVATDNCNGVTVTADPANTIAQGDIDVAPGMYTVSYIATDAASNTATCTFQVNVIDTEDPVVTCPTQSAITVRGTSDGCTFVMGSDAFDATYDENCSPITSLVHDHVSASSASTSTLSGHTFDAGNTVVTWTATDASGNTGSCSFVVTVLDDDAPTFACPSDMDVQGCAGTVPDVASALTGQDNCSSVGDITFTQSPTPGTLFGPTPGNVIPVTITATDEAGNSTQCEINITVIDSEMPVFNTCPAQALVFAADVDECSTFVNWSVPVAYDNCDNLLAPVLTSGPAPGTRQDVGMYTVVYTATDSDGNSATCSFDVEVMDTQAPTLAAGIPVDMTFNCDDPFVFVPFVMTSAMLTDNCTDPVDDIQNNVIPGQGPDPAMCEFYTYTDLYEWIATDDAGNSMRWTQRVSYQDTVAPVLTVPADMTVECGSSTDPAITGVATATDNCADTPFILVTYSDVMTDGCGLSGVITRTWVAADPCMNADTSIQIITVEDTTPPDLTCQDITVDLGSTGRAMITVADLISSVSDVCSDPDSLTFTLSQDTFNCDDFGVVTVRLEVTDPCGNMTVCTPTVTVTDTLEMCDLCDQDCDIACISSLNISVDQSSCTAIIRPSMLSSNITDQCNSFYEVELSSNGVLLSDTLDFSFVGKEIDYTIRNLDPTCGNSCWGTFLLEDKGIPGIEVSNDTIFCNQLVPASTPDTSFVRLIEGCSGARIQLVDERMETIDCDSMFTGRVIRQYRAVGENGMISPTVTQVIMIRRLQQSPITFPVNRMIATNNALTCDGGFALDANGNPLPTVGSDVGVPMMAGNPLFPLEDGIICSGYVEYSDRILTDSSACVKKIMRTWEVGEWWCGTTTPRMGVQIIEIVDNQGPVLTALPDIAVSTSGMACSAIVTLPPVQATDNCAGVARYTVDYEQGDFLSTNGGVVEIQDSALVTYTAYDACENSSQTSFMVRVTDQAHPIALCERWTNVPITIGETRVPAISFDDGSFDECGPVTYEVARLTDGCGQTAGMFRDSVTFCCMDAGDTIMVQLRVTDLGGNQNTCTVFAIVDDKVPPIVTCPADTVVQCGFTFDENRMSDVFGNPTVVDNCGDNVTFADRLIGQLSDCGLGVLTREIDVLSNGRILRTCTQLITYSGGDVFDPSTIVWPRDTVITGLCDSATIHPDNLLPGYDEPTFTAPACGQVGFGFTDAPFISADPRDSAACIKVLRTWSIIDWCSRDANGLYIVYDTVQVLKVMPDTSSSMRVAVGGMIVKEDGESIAGVEVELVGAESEYDMTEVSGDYIFADMPTGGTYEVLPLLDKDHDNGISTLDLVLIQRHILGLADLSGPYQRIAADVNADNKISGADVVEMRSLVLGKISEFENNTSWRFVDAGYTFPDQQDPWLEVFPEDYFISQLMGDMTIDFVGLKVGDINGSADNLQSDDQQVDNRSGYVSIAIEDQYVVAGQVVEIPVLAGSSGRLYGWQYAMATTGLNVKATIPGKAAMTPLYTYLRGGNLKMSYDHAEGLDVDAGDILYTITAIADRSGRLSDLLDIDDSSLRAEMYSGDNLTVRNATIEWREPAYELDAFAVEQNKPNPWSDLTQIDFYIPSDGPVTVRVMDMTGRLIKTVSDSYTAGRHSVTLRKEDLGAAGVLTYEVEYADKLEVRKMILLD